MSVLLPGPTAQEQPSKAFLTHRAQVMGALGPAGPWCGVHSVWVADVSVNLAASDTCAVGCTTLYNRMLDMGVVLWVHRKKISR